MKMLKRSLAMMLVLCMLFSMGPITAFAEETTDPADTAASAGVDGSSGDNTPADEPADTEPADTEPVDTEPADSEPVVDEPSNGEKTGTEVDATEDPYDIAITAVEPASVSLSYADTYRILHLDCGRKYFTKDWIIALVNEMAAAGFTHLELAFGNDGLRFLLDDMSVGSYSDAQVTAAIQQGNRNYYNFSTNELTESEMTAIIAHANSVGIKIIPLLNNPGHMDAIVTAASTLTGDSVGYNGSGSTVDLENAEAVAFVKGLVEKYVAYFDGKGCNEFNFGADEYANDVYDSGSMGFGALTYAGKYQLFVNYVNEMAALIKGYGMVPIAFNDGIYFNMDTSYNFDTQIMIAFWTSGWSGYQSASASTMASLGHKMINVHGNYYYVLGKNDQWDSNGYTYASNWSNSSFMGSTVSNPAGSMYCIWCDYPGAETETQIAANNRLILRAMAAAMQGKDISSISTEVIPGGFNADGTIAEDCNKVTVKDDAFSVEVTGCDLTSVTVTEAEAPVIADAAAVQAWDITPYAGDAKYEGAATVKLPIPADWNTKLVKGFYVENGQAVVVEKSTCADGFCSFEMPHFSVGGVMLMDATTVYDELIELEVGGEKEVTDTTGNYESSYTGDGLNTAIATVDVEGIEAVADTTVSTTKATTLEDGATYILRVFDTTYALSSNAGRGDWGTQTLAFEYNNLTAENTHLWTLEASGSGYKLKNAAGYLNLGTGNNTAYLDTTGEVFTITSTSTGWTIGNQNGRYINALGGLYNYYSAGGWTGDGTRFDLYKVTTSTNASTEITFTGVAPGTTYVTVGGTTYKIVVHGTIDITIKYQTTDGTVIKTETVTVADNATTYTVSNFNHNGKYYTVDNTTLAITPATVTEYTVTVTEVEEDLSQVASLTIEYWQTNTKAEEQRGNNVTAKTVTAEAAYSENGIDLSTIIPVTTYRQDSSTSDPGLVYWRSRLLPRATNEQTGVDGDDESLNGTGFTKVRYWNGTWAVYTDAGEWQNISLSDYQLVAYYMNDMELADEVSVATSDWGKKGNGEYGSSYLGSNNVSIAFQIVYEGGTTYPADTTAASLAPYSYFVDAWGNRGVGTIGINQIGDYQIWKITAETGEHSVTHNGNNNPITVNSFTWDGNEMTVWEDADNPVSQYTIQNPANNPNTDGYYDNLRWNETNESILIRIYIKAEETEDSLKVVYYDEKFGDTLVEYNVIVPDDSNFNNGIVYANTKDSATLPAFEGNAARVDATGYGIVNALDKPQNFRTDLTQVPEAVGKYNNGLYTYTGSVVSDDGMTITHYYTINTETLSPNFVADFGLPLSFPLSQVIGENQEELVESVSVNEKTRYGTLSYNSTTKMFTYTPTEILQNIDVLSINIKFTTEEEATLTNVGVTPATTVYYGEQYLTFSGGWTAVGTYANAGEQAAEVLGDSTYYGYDVAYASTAGASDGTARKSETIGNTATFTFTGTGIQVFANSSKDFGYVSVMVKNKDTGAIANVSMVDTDLKGTADTDTTGGQDGKNLIGLPVVSLVDLTGLPHGTYEVTITKIMDSDPVYIDGIRVFGTVDETKYTQDTNPFTADEEDAPDFYEVRDLVLTAIGIQDGDSVDYKTLYEQIYTDTVEIGASAVITSVEAPYGTTNRQDLLDNGPKNELYLFPGDTLTLNVSTDRVVQLGLKAPEGSASFELNEVAMSIGTTVDMFYKIAEKGGTTHTITINNTGDKILSVTLLKICDDPNVTFPALTEDNIKTILANAGYTAPEEPVDPEEPTEPEKPVYTMVELKGTDVLIDGTVFDYTGEPIEPSVTVNVDGAELVAGRDYSVSYVNNVEPGTASVIVRGIATASETLGYTGEIKIDFTINAPIVYADAVLTVKLVDYSGRTLAVGNIVANGKENDAFVFTADNILDTVNKHLPGGYAVVDRNAVSDVGVKFGSSNEVTVRIGKTATLKVTFVNLFGRKQGSETITMVQTSAGTWRVSASTIRALAPAGRRAVWLLSVLVPYGSTVSIVVPVI